jgi:hypothetical protein
MDFRVDKIRCLFVRFTTATKNKVNTSHFGLSPNTLDHKLMLITITLND